MSDAKLENCDNCDKKNTLKRLISGGSGMVFKGTVPRSHPAANRIGDPYTGNHCIGNSEIGPELKNVKRLRLKSPQS